MSDRFPNLGPMPTGQGHGPSLATGAASAQAGMVRIQRGSEVRYVWPVHVPGWLSCGWHLGDDRRSQVSETLAAVSITADSTATAPANGTPAVPTPANPPATVTESDGEPIEAHLPTNLLGLDSEPASTQVPAAGNDAVSASFAESEPDPDLEPADEAEPATDEAAIAEKSLPELPLTDTLVVETDDDSSNPPAVEPAAELLAAASAEPTPAPAPARRGRPRKVRPEPEAEPAAEAPAQEQPSTAPDSDEQQTTPAVLTSEGDDPFGIDPLL
jgi:hypothetical protein